MQATLIGDMVGSRQSEDRSRLQGELLTLLERVSDRLGHQLAVTLGDEFQGRYPSVEAAVEASWFLHLGAVGFARLRIGIGWGEITVDPGDGSPFGQDGPAWWRGRDAIEAVAEVSQGGRTLVRTETKWDELINSYLTLRDLHLERLDEVDAAIVLALTDQVTQRAIAGDLGLHESSVSRRIQRRRLTRLVEAATPPIPLPGP